VTVATSTGDELIAMIKANVPDAVILDTRMLPTFTDEGLITGVRLRELYPKIPLLFLSAYMDLSFFYMFQGELASIGYLSKYRVRNITQLRDALEGIARGKVEIDDELMTLARVQREKNNQFDVLTTKEAQVLGLISKGMSNLGIADHMSLSQKSVEAYVARIFTKLSIESVPGTNRRVTAVLAWLEMLESVRDR